MTSNAFDVVAEPARRGLLDVLMSRGALSVGELAARTGLSQPNTSRHLRVLREAGLVECRAVGQRRVYAVRGEGFAELALWLAPYVRLWQGGVNALEEHLGRSEAQSPGSSRPSEDQ